MWYGLILSQISKYANALVINGYIFPLFVKVFILKMQTKLVNMIKLWCIFLQNIQYHYSDFIQCKLRHLLKISDFLVKPYEE